jgi:hypothetical protein
MYSGTNNAYVVPFPYWVDTRLVGMNAGDPTRDYATPTDQLSATLNFPQPKMFLVKPEDTADLNLLRQLFPQGIVSNYHSKVGKDFYIYMVPAASSAPSENIVPGATPLP